MPGESSEAGRQPDALADGLREAFALLRRLDVGDEQRSDLHRRLVAVSDAAKHDTGRASVRLQRFLAELRTFPTR